MGGDACQEEAEDEAGRKGYESRRWYQLCKPGWSSVFYLLPGTSCLASSYTPRYLSLLGSKGADITGKLQICRWACTELHTTEAARNVELVRSVQQAIEASRMYMHVAATAPETEGSARDRDP